MTYGVCSDYKIDEEIRIITIKEPNNIPRIYKSKGFDYEYDEDILRNYLGSDDETKIVLNGEEISINDLFDGEKLKYKAVIVGYSDRTYYNTYLKSYDISIPIVYINVSDNNNEYIGQHSGILVDKNNNMVINYRSEIRDAHINSIDPLQ